MAFHDRGRRASTSSTPSRSPAPSSPPRRAPKPSPSFSRPPAWWAALSASLPTRTSPYTHTHLPPQHLHAYACPPHVSPPRLTRWAASTRRRVMRSVRASPAASAAASPSRSVSSRARRCRSSPNTSSALVCSRLLSSALLCSRLLSSALRCSPLLSAALLCSPLLLSSDLASESAALRRAPPRPSNLLWPSAGLPPTCHRPSTAFHQVLLLDEPTSGLDSAAAAAITRLLSEIAITEGTSIICTIQQPSAAVFSRFDQVRCRPTLSSAELN